MKTYDNQELKRLLDRYVEPPAVAPSVATAPVAVVATERGTESDDDAANS